MPSAEADVRVPKALERELDVGVYDDGDCLHSDWLL